MKIQATLELRKYNYEKDIDLPALALWVMNEKEDPDANDLLDAIVDVIWEDVESESIDFWDVEVDEVRVSRYALTTEALINAYAEARILASKPPFDPNQLTLGIS